MTKRVPIGLLIHFALWWAVSAWFWTKGYGWTVWSWMAPVAPVYLGCFYLQPHGDWQWGLAGIFVALALIAATVLALRHNRLWVVLSAHFAVILYWLIGFSLIATGV